MAAGGTFTIEQPSGSFFEFYPRFRSLIRCLEMVGGPGTDPCPICGVVDLFFVQLVGLGQVAFFGSIGAGIGECRAGLYCRTFHLSIWRFAQNL